MEHRPFDIMTKAVVDHEDHQHTVILAYDADDSAAVEIVFIPEFISWIFARDLLFTAAIQGAPAGEGDVLVQPGFSSQHGSHLQVTFRSPDGEETFILDRRTAQKFLYETMDLVALGEEDYSNQVDAALHVMLLGEGA